MVELIFALFVLVPFLASFLLLRRYLMGPPVELHSVKAARKKDLESSAARVRQARRLRVEDEKADWDAMFQGMVNRRS